MVVRNWENGLGQSIDAALFRVVFEQNAMGMALRAVDPRESLWLEVNDKFCEIFGYTREKLLQMTSIDLSYPEEQDDAVEYNQRLLSGEIKSYSREKRYIHKDGHTIWANIWLSAVDGSDDTPSMIISVIEDITERKREEAALQESEERFKAFIDASPSAILMKDIEGRYLVANKRWHEWFNPEGIEIIGKSVHDFYSREHAEAISAQDRKIVETGRAVKLEYETPFADGQVRNTLMQKFPIHDSGGAIVGVGGVNMDITERKEAERALSTAYEQLETIVEDRTRELTESRNRMRAIFDNAPVELYLKDLEGRYIEVNRQFEDLFNVKSPDIVGKLPNEIHNPELAAIVRDHDLEILESGKVSVEDQKAVTETGERVLRTVKFPVFDDNQVITGLGAVVTDVTELELARQEAIQANLSKSEFLASMSHELRTPMNAVLGFAQMLELDSRNTLSTAQKEYINIILQGGNHLLDLINEVLDLAKIEAGQLTLSMEEVSANEVIADCVALTCPLADQRGIRIINQFSSSPTTKLLADRLRLQQVLLNLVSNAIKFNRTDGAVTIDGRETNDSFIRISVTDSGVGIAKKDHANVFDMFHRLGVDPMVAQEGTGIGLTVTKMLVEQMAGRIGFESELGVGSTFWFELPLVSKKISVQ